MNITLLIVDIQNDYFPGGKMQLHGSIEAGINAGRLLEFFRTRKQPVIHVQHVAAHPGSTFFLPNTIGVEIHESVTPLPGELIIQKHFPNAFRDTDLLECLRKLDTEKLIITGMMTHMCIDATTRAAFDLGFKCMVIADACATRELTFQGLTISAEYVHASFLAALSGTYAEVVGFEDCNL